MPDNPLSLQDHFLNSVRRAKSPATIFLVKGVKLQGVITWFDAFSLLLRRESRVAAGLQAFDLDDHAAASARRSRASSRREAGSQRASLQDVFLAAAAREKAPMTLFLVNGVMLQGAGGRLRSILACCSSADGQVQLVYKHAISTLAAAACARSGRPRATSGAERMTLLRSRQRCRARRARCRGRARDESGRARGAQRKHGSRRRKGSPRRSASTWWRASAFRVRQVRPATLLGKGQVEEIAEIARES